jgi:hypothetical protein
MMMVVPDVLPLAEVKAKDGVVGEIEDLWVEQGTDHVGDAGDTEQLGGERPGQGVALEQHQVRSQVAPRCNNVVDHVVEHDLTEQSRDEVVVGPFRRDAIAGIASRALPEPFEPLPMSLPAFASRAPDRSTIGAHPGASRRRGPSPWASSVKPPSPQTASAIASHRAAPVCREERAVVRLPGEV